MFNMNRTRRSIQRRELTEWVCKKGQVVAGPSKVAPPYHLSSQKQKYGDDEMYTRTDGCSVVVTSHSSHGIVPPNK